MYDSILVWFRRDLRDYDHAALSEALRRGRKVFCAFVFDTDVLDRLPRRVDRRVEFIMGSLHELDEKLRARGGSLLFLHGRAVDEIPRLALSLGVEAVFANRDYEPEALQRDQEVRLCLRSAGVDFVDFKDQVIFDRLEVLTPAGSAYKVFTPYKKAWLARLSEFDLMDFGTDGGTLATPRQETQPSSLADIGFTRSDLANLGVLPGMRGARLALQRFLERIDQYGTQRNYPHADACSRLSVHLRFGTISIRELVALALSRGARATESGASIWLAELIWREFFFMILAAFPHVTEGAFKPAYDAIAWDSGPSAETRLDHWCAGRTGYPLVDAAMRQLNSTGYMHNRLRMIVASFLCKDLGIDWRRGEAYFADHLLDYDLAANNGGWQWAASCGCDAQPYFRVFNPVTQSQRYDPEGLFIRQYVPELAPVPTRRIHAPWLMRDDEYRDCGLVRERDVPQPIVDHDTARRRTLERYAVVRRAEVS